MGGSDRAARSARRVGRTLAVVVMAGIVAVAGPAAVSEEGRTASVAPAAAPGAPSAPRLPVAAPANGEARLSWVAPSSSGASAVTSYVVTPYRDDVAGRPMLFRSRSTRQIVSGLTNGKSYSFTIAARSRAGTGPKSTLSAPITVGAPTAPSKVTVRPGDGRAEVSWAAPSSNNGSAITAYLVTSYLNGVAQTRLTFESAADSQTVGGLGGGERYTFRVAARNARGAGPASAPSKTFVVKAVPDTPPPARGYFSILPPGSALPSDAACAARVNVSSWEPRADNDVANHTVAAQPNTLGNFSQWNTTWNATYKPRITGNYTGTTDEIIQWAACKWGWSDNVVRAQAVVESNWYQSMVSDFVARSAGHCTFDYVGDPCPTSFGIIQVKWYYHPAVSSSSSPQSSYPQIKTSTAFNLDLELAELRGCYDGMSTYLGNTRGDLWGCIGYWYSGAWHSPGGDAYAAQVQSELAAKPWLTWPDQSGNPAP